MTLLQKEDVSQCYNKSLELKQICQGVSWERGAQLNCFLPRWPLYITVKSSLVYKLSLLYPKAGIVHDHGRVRKALKGWQDIRLLPSRHRQVLVGW